MGDTPIKGKGKRQHNKGGLSDVAWHRVVLDEAHTIRNRTTKLFKAATALKAAHRWAVTGAPRLLPIDEIPCAGIWGQRCHVAALCHTFSATVFLVVDANCGPR